MRRILCAALALGLAPAVAQTGPLAPVEQAPLAKDAFSTGFLSRDAGALDEDLWRGADAKTLMALLDAAPARPAGPSLGDALRRVLNSPGEAPADATPALGGAKLTALARAGLIDEARRIESLSAGTDRDPKSAQAMAIADIVSNDVPGACERARSVSDSRDAFWVKLRVVCYAAANELDAAELALNILNETGLVSKADAAIFRPLAAGGKPLPEAEPVGALHYAAFRIAEAPVTADMLGAADAGVVRAVAEDASAANASADWATRLAAATLAAAMGAMNGAELKALYDAAPPESAPEYKAIAALAGPERLRDKAGLVAREIDTARDFPALYAASLLYADDIAAFEGAIVAPSEAETFALARLAAGDAASAEKWLLAATTGAQGAPGQGTRVAELVNLLAALDAEAGARAAAAAKVAIAPLQSAAPAKDSRDISPRIAGAAIEAAASGSAGAAALAGLAASSAEGDAVARALMMQSLKVAGLNDIVRRRKVEEAIAAMLGAGAVEAAESEAEPSGPAQGIVPRLKPKRAS